MLMPRDFLLRDVATATGDSEEVTDRLARRYRVSFQAMQIRLTNLGFIPPV
jgi:Zn-dependent peptidase ImmA (M78 family)